MTNSEDIIQAFASLNTTNELWESIDREDLDQVLDPLLDLKIKIEELVDPESPDDPAEELLLEFNQTINSLVNRSKTFDPDSDVESFKQDIQIMKNEAQDFLDE